MITTHKLQLLFFIGTLNSFVWCFRSDPFTSRGTCPPFCNCENDIVDCTEILNVDLTFHNLSYAKEIRFNPNVTFLNFQYTSAKITNETFKGLKELRSLRLTGLDLSRVTGAEFKWLRNLTILSVDDTGIVVTNDTFRHLTALAVLVLNGNDLSKITGTEFQSVSNLRTLDAKRTHFRIDKDVFRYLANVTTLSLNENNLFTLDQESFAQIKNLSHLDLRENFLKSFDEDIIRPYSDTLSILALSNNNISELKLRAEYAKLWNLDVKENGLQYFDVNIDRMPSLTKLILEGNPIECSCRTLHIATVIRATQGSILLGACGSPSFVKSVPLKRLNSNHICHDGHCSARAANNTCICPKYVTGRYCDKLENVTCSNLTCLNNATCVTTGGLAKCVCPQGFSGVQCENAIQVMTSTLSYSTSKHLSSSAYPSGCNGTVSGGKGGGDTSRVVTIATSMVVFIVVFIAVMIVCVRIFRRRRTVQNRERNRNTKHDSSRDFGKSENRNFGKVNHAKSNTKSAASAGLQSTEEANSETLLSQSESSLEPRNIRLVTRDPVTDNKRQSDNFVNNSQFAVLRTSESESVRIGNIPLGHDSYHLGKNIKDIGNKYRSEDSTSADLSWCLSNRKERPTQDDFQLSTAKMLGKEKISKTLTC